MIQDLKSLIESIIQQANLDEVSIQNIMKNPSRVTRDMNLLLRYNSVPKVNEEALRSIMGENFIGTEEIQYFFNKITDDEEEAFSRISFSEEVIKSCAQTHILIADTGRSIIDLRKCGLRSFCISLIYEGFDEEKFPHTWEKPCWRLIRKTLVPDSFAQILSDQKKLIDIWVDEIPSARQIFYLHTLIDSRFMQRHFQDDERRFLLKENSYGRTCTLASREDYVYIGRQDTRIAINVCPENIAHQKLGIYSARQIIVPK